MSAPTQFELIVFITTLVVLALAYSLVFTWNWPLKNGPGFFLGVEVPAGFYEGPGRSWLKGYRAMLVALYLILAAFFGACFAFGRSDLAPLCGFWALLYTATILAFSSMDAPQTRIVIRRCARLRWRLKPAASAITSPGRWKHSWLW